MPFFLLKQLLLPGADMSHCHENPKLLKHLKCRILQSLKDMKNAYLKYIYAHLENQTNMITRLTIMDEYPSTTYIFNYTLHF